MIRSSDSKLSGSLFLYIKVADIKLRYTARIVVKIAYGYSIKDNDPFAILIDKIGKMVHNAGPPASTPVDFFPWCEFIHFVSFR